jgi:microcompartment protein CcmL/EutN
VLASTSIWGPIEAVRVSVNAGAADTTMRKQGVGPHPVEPSHFDVVAVLKLRDETSSGS